MTIVVAIDGPAAAGKGTLARRIAEHFDLAYLDTGAIYRATGKAVMDAGVDTSDVKACADLALRLDPASLSDPALRTEEAGQMASKVSAIPEVRAALLEFQRGFAAHPPAGRKGAVLDGRDVGTVVCPDADVKLFVTASDEVRAMRRFKELQGKGENAIYARVLQEMQERDARDRSRAVAPLKPAEDATLIDTSDMDADQVFAKAAEIVAGKLA